MNRRLKLKQGIKKYFKCFLCRSLHTKYECIGSLWNNTKENKWYVKLAYGWLEMPHRNHQSGKE